MGGGVSVAERLIPHLLKPYTVHTSKVEAKKAHDLNRLMRMPCAMVATNTLLHTLPNITLGKWSKRGKKP